MPSLRARAIRSSQALKFAAGEVAWVSQAIKRE